MTHSLLTLALLSILFFATSRASAETPTASAPPDYWVYVGTFGNKGIALFKLDSAAGTLTPQGTAVVETDPNYLAVHPNGKVLYAVCAKGKDGALDSFSINTATGKLTPLNQQSTGGSNAVYVSIDPAGKSAFVANYDGPSIAALPLKTDGSLGTATIDTHTGSSVNQGRQKRAFPHSILPDPAGKFVFSPDLGCDKVFSYKVGAQGALTANDPATFSVPAGAGPRHMAFSPTAPYAYITTEMASEILTCSYEAAKGTLKQIDITSIRPEGFGAWISGAEIKIHPSGKFLYASVRGASTIAVFSIDAASGKLSPIQQESIRGNTPRGFNLDPTGNFLIAGGQDSGTLSLFAIDPKTGRLTPKGDVIKTPTPVSVVFVPIAK